MFGLLVLIGVIVLAVVYLFAFSLMRAAGRVPPRMPNAVDDEDWTDDLVDGTAAGLIDWEE